MRSLAPQLQALIRPRPTLFVSEKCMELWDQNTTFKGIGQAIHNHKQITIILSWGRFYSNFPSFRCSSTILIKRRHRVLTSATTASASACKQTRGGLGALVHAAIRIPNIGGGGDAITVPGRIASGSTILAVRLLIVRPGARALRRPAPRFGYGRGTQHPAPHVG